MINYSRSLPAYIDSMGQRKIVLNPQLSSNSSTHTINLINYYNYDVIEIAPIWGSYDRPLFTFSMDHFDNVHPRAREFTIILRGREGSPSEVRYTYSNERPGNLPASIKFGPDLRDQYVFKVSANTLTNVKQDIMHYKAESRIPAEQTQYAYPYAGADNGNGFIPHPNGSKFLFGCVKTNDANYSFATVKGPPDSPNDEAGIVNFQVALSNITSGMRQYRRMLPPAVLQTSDRIYRFAFALKEFIGAYEIEASTNQIKRIILLTDASQVQAGTMAYVSPPTGATGADLDYRKALSFGIGFNDQGAFIDLVFGNRKYSLTISGSIGNRTLTWVNQVGSVFSFGVFQNFTTEDGVGGYDGYFPILSVGSNYKSAKLNAYKDGLVEWNSGIDFSRIRGTEVGTFRDDRSARTIYMIPVARSDESAGSVMAVFHKLDASETVSERPAQSPGDPFYSSRNEMDYFISKQGIIVDVYSQSATGQNNPQSPMSYRIMDMPAGPFANSDLTESLYGVSDAQLETGSLNGISTCAVFVREFHILPYKAGQGEDTAVKTFYITTLTSLQGFFRRFMIRNQSEATFYKELLELPSSVKLCVMWNAFDMRYYVAPINPQADENLDWMFSFNTPGNMTSQIPVNKRYSQLGRYLIDGRQHILPIAAGKFFIVGQTPLAGKPADPIAAKRVLVVRGDIGQVRVSDQEFDEACLGVIDGLRGGSITSTPTGVTSFITIDKTTRRLQLLNLYVKNTANGAEQYEMTKGPLSDVRLPTSDDLQFCVYDSPVGTPYPIRLYKPGANMDDAHIGLNTAVGAFSHIPNNSGTNRSNLIAYKQHSFAARYLMNLSEFQGTNLISNLETR